MKTIFTIFLSLVLAKGCGEEANAIDSAVVEYEALSRGFYKTIKIENKKLYVVKSRNDKPHEVSLSAKQWNSLVELFKEINLDELSNLKAPTEKRMYDGAAHARFAVTLDGKNYSTQSFDHGHPPVAIEKFVNKLTELSFKE
ncbi:hypothetical protein [Flavobacterium sp.]|uniref:hypothetical protein n=1 Tax=Flavobacterium sp. TaxID=239 RepID=UPI002FDAEF04